MLDVKSIDLHYGAAQALRGISLQAAPGEVTCVLGRNGVGKSSLLRALAYLRGLGQIAIVLVEQYLDFARELGDRFAVMDRGAIVYSCTRADLDETALQRALAI